MKLADIVGGKIVIHPDMLMVPCFKALWEKDDDKEHATKVISYIVFKNKWDSPYVLSTDNSMLEEKLKDRVFGNKDYRLTTEESICEKEYKDFQNTRVLQMLTNMRLKLDSISAYYGDSLEDELDEKKIKDLLAGMTSVGNVIKSISTLEDMVKAENITFTKVKGDAKINPYELQ